MFHENTCRMGWKMPTKPTEPGHPDWNQGGPKKNTTAQDPLFEVAVFALWECAVKESKSDLRVEQEPGKLSVYRKSRDDPDI